MGDGEIQEGQVWEAAMLAGHRKLDNLVVIVDNNNLQIDGTVEEVNSPYPIDKKFEAFNFHVINVADGNDMDQLKAAFDEAGLKKLPKAKDLSIEYAALLKKKKEAYPDYRKARDEMQELMKAQKNVEMFFAEEKDTAEKEPTR